EHGAALIVRHRGLCGLPEFWPIHGNTKPEQNVLGCEPSPVDLCASFGSSLCRLGELGLKSKPTIELNGLIGCLETEACPNQVLFGPGDSSLGVRILFCGFEYFRVVGIYTWVYECGERM